MDRDCGRNGRKYIIEWSVPGHTRRFDERDEELYWAHKSLRMAIILGLHHGICFLWTIPCVPCTIHRVCSTIHFIPCTIHRVTCTSGAINLISHYYFLGEILVLSLLLASTWGYGLPTSIVQSFIFYAPSIKFNVHSSVFCVCGRCRWTVCSQLGAGQSAEVVSVGCRVIFMIFLFVEVGCGASPVLCSWGCSGTQGKLWLTRVTQNLG